MSKHIVKYIPGPSDSKYVIRTKYPGSDQSIQDRVVSVEELAEIAPESIFFSYSGYVKDYGSWEVWRIVPADMQEFQQDLSASRQGAVDKEKDDKRKKLQREIYGCERVRKIT